MSTGVLRIREILAAEFPEAAAHAKLSRTLEAVDRAGASIGDGTERIDGILTRLRSFARLDQADLQDTTVEQCVSDALALLRPGLDAIDVQCGFGDTPTIRCYPARLNQAFLNVLTNAAEAMDQGTVRVSTHGAGKAVVVTIEDEGHGIAAEDIDRVFDPGFTTRGVGVGTGLGLPITYLIVNDHGGSIALTSEPGRGTTVTIELPVAGERAEG
jgi:signal transduction histidine kinase